MAQLHDSADLLFTRKQVFEWLKDNNYVSAHLEFSGGGDEGGVDNILLYKSNAKKAENFPSVSVKYTWITGTKNKKGHYVIEVPDEKVDLYLLERGLRQPIFDKYYTFAGEFYVWGTLIWDVETQTVTISGDEREDRYMSFESEV